MKKKGAHRLPLIVVLLVQAGLANSAAAQALSVSGNPSSLTVNTAIAGAQPVAVSNATTTYSVAASILQKKKITARLNMAMPSGTTLTVSMVAPSGATSMGAVVLTPTAQDLVVNISNVLASTQAITFQLTANTSAGALAASTRTVTYSLVNHP